MATDVSNVVNHFPSAQDGFSTTTSGSVASGASTVGLNSVAGYTNGDVVVLVVDPGDSTKKQAFTGVIDSGGVQVTGVKWTSGTDQAHSAGATVVDYETATHWSMIAKGMKVSHNQDGTFKAGAISNSNMFGSGVVPNTAVAAGYGLLKDIQVYTADDTWTKPSGLKFAIVEVVGGGGGGGGVATTSTSQSAYGGGGGGGGYAMKKVAAASLGSTEGVTVGAGGAGGVAGNNNGSNGEDSLFGSHCSASGGGGGGGDGAGGFTGGNLQPVNGTDGGNGVGGDINIAGGGGSAGFPFYDTGRGVMGGGGSSRLGAGARVLGQGSTVGSTAGLDGKLYGGGGGAAGNGTNSSAKAGGDGADGVVIVWEFY